jgi:polyisoprenyl-teichoic acid--peptidoglycan teichoic acid transferase
MLIPRGILFFPYPDHVAFHSDEALEDPPTMLKKHQQKIIIGLVVIVCLVLVGLGLAWFTPPLGTPLPKQTARFNPSLFESPPISGELVPQATPVVTENNPDQAVSLPPDEPVCGGPPSLSVLVLGIDKQAQADAIRLVSIDFQRETISVLSIPRDFYVPIVDMADHGITQGRINATFGYGEWFNGRGKGIISVANNLEYNFGVTFDHYIVLSFNNIAQYIDDIGGVELLLDQPVADGKLYFASGQHHMDGDTAVGFMRMRYFDTDFARIRRQSMVIRAFYSKAMHTLTPFQQVQFVLTGVWDKNIQTSFAVNDIMPLVCLARRVDSKQVNFVEIPAEMYRSHTTTTGGNVQIPYDTVVPFIQGVMNGSMTP